MPALNFQKQFAPLVESGEKRQTIRPQRKRPFKVGDRLYLFTGLRTKSCKRLIINPLKVETFRDKRAYVCVVCKSVEEITIYDKFAVAEYHAWMDSATNRGGNEFAKADGFENYQQMVQFFKKQYGLPFEGVLIKW